VGERGKRKREKNTNARHRGRHVSPPPESTFPEKRKRGKRTEEKKGKQFLPGNKRLGRMASAQRRSPWKVQQRKGGEGKKTGKKEKRESLREGTIKEKGEEWSSTRLSNLTIGFVGQIELTTFGLGKREKGEKKKKKKKKRKFFVIRKSTMFTTVLRLVLERRNSRDWNAGERREREKKKRKGRKVRPPQVIGSVEKKKGKRREE